MIRKLNYTGRKKINRSDIDITLYKNGNSQYFDASLELDSLKLPADSVIYIEPYYRSSFMRFECGTIGRFTLPQSTELSDLPSSDLLHFRVKVVNENEEAGKILAYADRIKPIIPEKEDSPSKSILPVQFSTDLDRQIWRVTFDDTQPILEISSKVENGRDLVKSDEFISLAYPSILNEIFTRIIYEHRDVDMEEDHWAAQWMRFAKYTLSVADKPPGDDDNLEDLKEWATEVVNTFCRKMNIYAYFRKSAI